MTNKELETRLINLENAFIQSQQNMTPVIDEVDTTSSKVETQGQTIKTNSSDISDNRQGLTETFEATLNNTDDVAINRQAIEELYEMITAESEVK